VGLEDDSEYVCGRVGVAAGSGAVASDSSGRRHLGQGVDTSTARAPSIDGIGLAHAIRWGVGLEDDSEYVCGRVGVVVGSGTFGVSSDAAVQRVAQG